MSMNKRQSINGSHARHENPIPNACRIRNIVMSSVIGGANPGTRDLPPSLEQQVANVFGYIRDDIEAAGGTVDDIIKITFWVKDPGKQRAALNAEWVKMFPNPDSRPARHTQHLVPDSRALVQADFIAVLS
jgi:enamine deaminase RidA (YjgF/YER057c/UK114 family)